MSKHCISLLMSICVSILISFSSGALEASRVTKRPDDVVAMGGIKCDAHAQTIEDCEWKSPSNCSQYKVAAVTCKENTGLNPS